MIVNSMIAMNSKFTTVIQSNKQSLKGQDICLIPTPSFLQTLSGRRVVSSINSDQYRQSICRTKVPFVEEANIIYFIYRGGTSTSNSSDFIAL